jgi:hypothetical protein
MFISGLHLLVIHNILNEIVQKTSLFCITFILILILIAIPTDMNDSCQVLDTSAHLLSHALVSHSGSESW